MTQQEKILRADGYEFTGIYSHDREEAKRRAKELRDKGNKARVISKVYYNRVTSVTGYSVYMKQSITL